MPAMPELDTPKMAGLMVLGALALLALLRKGFAPIRVGIGD